MLKIKIEGNPPANLKRAKAALKSLPDLVSQLGEQQHQYTLADFGQVTPDGAAHPDGPAFHNLVISGALRDSIALQSGGLTATISTSNPLARIHQSGEKKIPARPFMGIGDRYMSRHEQAAQAWLKSRLG